MLERRNGVAAGDDRGGAGRRGQPPGAGRGLTLRALASLSALSAAAALSGQVASPEAAGPGIVVFGGDTAFGEEYQAQRESEGRANILKAKGYDYPLERLDPLLAGADWCILNLETSLSTLQESPFAGRKEYIHQGDVRLTPETLIRHGVTLVSLANNHAMDYGPAGLDQSIEALDHAGLPWIGAGRSLAAAARPYASELGVGDRVLRIVIAAGFQRRSAYEKEYSYYATETSSGVNGWSADSASAQIREIREREPHALLVAYPHWGDTYKWKTDRQTEIGHALVDAGADLVLGHGAHVMQEIERYRDRWIIYGLGNFMFLSGGRYDEFDAVPFGLVARLSVFPGARPTIQLDLTPILTDNLQSDFQPRPGKGADLQRVRFFLLAKSPDIELLKDRMTIVDGALRITLAPHEHVAGWTVPAGE